MKWFAVGKQIVARNRYFKTLTSYHSTLGVLFVNAAIAPNLEVGLRKQAVYGSSTHCRIYIYICEYIGLVWTCSVVAFIIPSRFPPATAKKVQALE